MLVHAFRDEAPGPPHGFDDVRQPLVVYVARMAARQIVFAHTVEAFFVSQGWTALRMRSAARAV